jgi:hypothetical protein
VALASSLPQDGLAVASQSDIGTRLRTKAPACRGDFDATLFFERANLPHLAQERAMNITKNLGMLLLAIYLILAGITLLFHITIPAIVMGILALVAGILILIGK